MALEEARQLAQALNEVVFEVEQMNGYDAVSGVGATELSGDETGAVHQPGLVGEGA